MDSNTNARIDKRTVHHTESCVYIGHTYFGGKSSFVFRKITESGEMLEGSNSLHYFGKRPKGVYPGGIYLLSFTSESSMLISGDNAPKYKGMHGNRDLVLEYQTADRAADTQKMAASKARQENTFSELRERLAPVKELMRKTNTQGRAAIIAVVINELTA